ncbi:hypothetical protein [Micromonospora sp. D75]|uniref:hypothetical protein n=1 Tax=Micromonospora sp. D75 TaxID=2824885 RepID=UPI001B38B685|nr:hypothetical protein [Micromonospora sp. D75]MBQ1066416.1 hypothetical protein [Micromonospora sp. D75]
MHRGVLDAHADEVTLMAVPALAERPDEDEMDQPDGAHLPEITADAGPTLDAATPPTTSPRWWHHHP